jgi:hypothetical protein
VEHVITVTRTSRLNSSHLFLSKTDQARASAR